MKTHKFELTVRSNLSLKQAETAVLVAFARRDPDGCEFFLKRKPAKEKEVVNAKQPKSDAISDECARRANEFIKSRKKTDEDSNQQAIRRIRVYRDDSLPAFGAWAAGSMKDGDPTIILNVSACLLPCVDDVGEDVNHTTEEKKWIMIGTLMHEFGHALQEFFDLEFTEDRIEELTMDYEKHYLPNYCEVDKSNQSPPSDGIAH